MFEPLVLKPKDPLSFDVLNLNGNCASDLCQRAFGQYVFCYLSRPEAHGTLSYYRYIAFDDHTAHIEQFAAYNNFDRFIVSFETARPSA